MVSCAMERGLMGIQGGCEGKSMWLLMGLEEGVIGWFLVGWGGD